MNDSVLVLGDINVDIIGRFDDFPTPGGCVYSDKPVLIAGGSGFNTFIGLRKLELKSTIATMIGEDIFGEFLEKNLKDAGIECVLPVSETYPTGVVFSVSAENERTFYSFRKDAADIHITIHDLEGIDLQSRMVYITGVSIVEGIETYDTFLEILRKARKNGAKIFFDPNMRKNDIDSIEKIERVIPNVDVFLPSADELTMFFSKSVKYKGFSDLEKNGVSQIWIKKGSRGCSLVSPEQRFEISGASVEVLDTTGAGDAFNAAVIWGYMNGLSLLETGIYANVFAGLSTEKIGAATSYPNKEKLMRSEHYKSVKMGVKVL